MRRAACNDWPRILCPAPGAYPPAAERRGEERVLHVANFPGEIGQMYLHTIASEYRMVYWPGRPPAAVVGEMLAAARSFRPTVVFIQIQCPGVLEPHHIEALRALCDPSCVICNWDGDQHYEPRSRQRRWFVDLGQVCDASLVVNTEHPEVYAELGVRHPGFFEIAADPSIFHPTDPAPDVPPVVLLANASHAVHATRHDYVRTLDAQLGPARFGVYGSGWSDLACGHDSLVPTQESAVYCAARAALSVSARNDLPRYTSDRLFRLLASGGVPVVEAFPDCAGLGLIDGHNCILWSGEAGLHAALEAALSMHPGETQAMRDAAADLGHDHLWPQRHRELLAIIDAVRGSR